MTMMLNFEVIPDKFNIESVGLVLPPYHKKNKIK
jgi:hypothetical protein